MTMWLTRNLKNKSNKIKYKRKRKVKRIKAGDSQ